MEETGDGVRAWLFLSGVAGAGRAECPGAGASVVSHKYGYEDARAFWLSARRDDL